MGGWMDDVAFLTRIGRPHTISTVYSCNSPSAASLGTVTLVEKMFIPQLYTSTTTTGFGPSRGMFERRMERRSSGSFLGGMQSNNIPKY